MSDRNGHGRGNGRTTPAPRLPTTNGVIDSLWRDLFERIQDMVVDAKSTMGTVVDKDGGQPIIHIDDERSPRAYGFARAKGVRYSIGDRVELKRTRGDDWIVTGVVSALPDEAAVFEEQLGRDAVSTRVVASGAIIGRHILTGQIENDHVKANQVTGDRMVSNAVTTRELASSTSSGGRAVGSNHIQDQAVTNDHIKPDQITKTKLDPGFQTEINDKASKSQLPTKESDFYSQTFLDSKFSAVETKFGGYYNKNAIDTNVFARFQTWVSENFPSAKRFCIHSCQNKDHEKRIQALEVAVGRPKGSYKYCDSQCG